MQEILNSAKAYTNQFGVKTSIIVTIISAALLTISLVGISFKNEQLEMLCFLSLIFEFIYGVGLTFMLLQKKEKYIHLAPFLFLNWFIGCFCTNVFINIFENLPVWVYVITFMFCFTNFLIYRQSKTDKLTWLAYFLNGSSFLLILYYVIYLLPFAPFSVIGILAFGIGFYGVVPMIVTISHLIILTKKFKTNRNYFYAFATGISIVVLSFVLFTFQLNRESIKMTANSATKSFDSNDDLPSYVIISQNLKPNFFNQILLKKDLVYESTSSFLEFRGLNSIGTKQYNERKSHHPIINLAYIFANDLDLSTDDRINILKSNFDKRLETEEQLWSGRDLITKNIKEDVKVYPKERLAYTEITMDVACSEKTWGQKEAIYSFQLPEGSVATSLSLWVNGVERKGVLTTKEKAANAYNQIVGVEARDPSLMQWREGNRIVVRVFPISYDLPRTFKCGFTTPLKQQENELLYQSIKITGPNILKAETLSRLQVVGNETFETDRDFELKNNFYSNESHGLEKWKARFKSTTITNETSFTWKNSSYTIVPLEKETVDFTPSEIVLDLNSSWEMEEIETLLSISNVKYFVILNNQKRALTKSNLETVVKSFENLHYSLLPFYNLESKSLVLTKCNNFSANFEELETSKYLEKLKSNTKEKQIRVINIGEEINPFWQTIKEQNYVEYVNLDLKTATDLVKKNQFISIKHAANSVNIEPSNCAIKEIPSTENTKSTASNHLYRMYAFGKILDEHVQIQSDSLASNRYVALAKEANIVTPISSLIVLETDADYEKHGIEKNVNSLGNASINNDGAVPEPHEWALIIIGVLTLYFYYRKNLKNSH